MKDKAKITLRGEAGRSDPDVLPGDVVFVLECKQHKTFQRVNQDLTFQKEITLHEALCGCEFSVHHLDNRILRVTPPPPLHLLTSQKLLSSVHFTGQANR